MLITTKSHMIKKYSEQQEQFHGIDDLTEDFGEQNHQYEANADRLRASVRDFAQQQALKSRGKVKNKDPLVKIKVEQ
eukprot:13804984-Ditylum_brightwellii.AAC.1